MSQRAFGLVVGLVALATLVATARATRPSVAAPAEPESRHAAAPTGGIFLPLGLRGFDFAAEPPPETSLTYYRDAMPILETRCTKCHTPGGIAPFSLTGYEQAHALAPAIAQAVGEHIMPPLPPEPAACTPIQDDREMPETERNVLVDWVRQGAVAGDPATAPEVTPPVDPLGTPERTVDIGVDYLSQASTVDDYRCFMVDSGFERDVYAQAVGIKPGNSAIVHHAFVWVLPPNQWDAIAQKDAEEPGPGYTCFGGPGFQEDWIGGYAPGTQTRAYPDGSGVTIPAGSRFVVQVHYNFLNSRASDRTSVLVWEAPTKPRTEPRMLTIVNPLFRIPAGVKAYTATASSRIVASGRDPRIPIVAEEGLAWSAVGHMHMLGTSIKMELLRSDGSSQCLLDIPHWDFHWQGSYQFEQPVAVKAGDQVKITCVWDNSPENQPIVDGKRQEPRTVTWGDGSLDEMCLGYLTIVDPPK